MDPNIKRQFSRKYSFIPAPNSYYILLQYNIFKQKSQGLREKIVNKLPTTQIHQTIKLLEIIFHNDNRLLGDCWVYAYLCQYVERYTWRLMYMFNRTY